MTDPAMPAAITDPAMGEPAMTEPAAPGLGARGGTIGLRLALAFLVVALAAVALLAVLTAVFAAADVSTLASQQRAELASAIAVAAGAAWDRNDTWSTADLFPVLDLAARTGEAVQIRDQAGHVVASSPGFATAPGPQSSPAIVARGERVARPWSGPPVRGSTPPTASCRPRCCGPSPGPPGRRPCSRCSPGSPWPGGSPARSPG